MYDIKYLINKYLRALNSVKSVCCDQSSKHYPLLFSQKLLIVSIVGDSHYGKHHQKLDISYFIKLTQDLL